MIVAFDQYQRYKHVQEMIELIREDKSYKILEVGANEHKNLEKFLPNDSITYLDIEVPESLQNDPQYIQADATNMPQVPSESFEFVVALDVFEHIPKEARQNFLKELHRVAKQGVIISAPYNSSQVINAEMRANEYYKQLYGRGFRWLEEHRENDLPDIEQTTKFFKNNGINYLQFEHGSLSVWEKLIDLHFLFADKNEYHQQRFFIDQYYNENVYQYDYDKHNYRVFFVSGEGNNIDLIRSWINNRIKNSKSQDALENLSQLNWLEQQIKNTYLTKKLSEITMQNQQVSALENTISQNQIELSNTINNLQFDINQLSLKLQEDLNQISMTVKNELVEYSKNLQIELYQTYKNDQGKTDEINNQNYENLLKEIQSIKNEISVSNNKLIEENLEIKKEIELKEDHIRNIEALNKAILSTKGWKALEKFRKMKLFLSRNKTAAIPKVINKIKNEGIKSTLQTIEQKISNELQEETYNEWFLKRLPIESQIQEMRNQIEKFNKKPLISVVMPTFNTPSDLLSEAIQSLKNQIYPHWELCICDDRSPNEQVWKELQQYANEDKRIKVIRSSENLNISGATNLAISLATGEYVGFLDHDDVLTKDALFEVVKVINEYDPDLIYSDEDKLEMDGTYSDPFFKPNWSPDLLLSLNYICHFSVYKKEIGDEIGWFRNEFNGAQDYDFVLKFTDRTNRIYHIPKVLYHWRKVPTSTSVNPNSKPHAHIAGKNVVEEFLINKYGDGATVDETDYLYVYDPRYKLPNDTKISIIIPTKDHVELIKDCVESIIKQSSYENYEIIILNNNSVEEQTYLWFKEIQNNEKVKVIDAFFDFNWSKLNNFGIEHADGDVFIFLNNDVKVITHDWMERLAEKALRDNVGTVGALLLYEDGTIQHAGVIVGMGGWADHVFKGMNPVHYGTPYVSPMVPRNVLASTGACLAISRKTIEEIGNFNEEFIICGSDVEISLRAFKKGYVNIYDPYVKLYHYESKTRDSYIPEEDFVLSEIHYSPYREKVDPYFNPNLRLDSPIPKRN